MNATHTTRKPAIETTIAGGNLTLTFSDGRTLDLDHTSLSAEIKQAALIHGLKQKLVDAAAISRDPSTGRAATIETKYNAVKEVYDRLLAGQWNKNREAGTGGAGGLLFRALVSLYPSKTPEQLREYLDGKTPAEQAALRKNPKIADAIATLRATSDGSDSDELLAELEQE